MKINNFIKLLSITLFCLGLIAFGLGIHEVDLSFNMDRNAIDMALDGSFHTTTQVYIRGLRLLLVSELIFLISFLLLLGSKENQ